MAGARYANVLQQLIVDLRSSSVVMSFASKVSAYWPRPIASSQFRTALTPPVPRGRPPSDDWDRREGGRLRALCRFPDDRDRCFEEPVRRDSPKNCGVAASAGRINRAEGGKRDAFHSNCPAMCAMAVLDWTEFPTRRPFLISRERVMALWNRQPA
jgi:hypothetical protein